MAKTKRKAKKKVKARQEKKGKGQSKSKSKSKTPADVQSARRESFGRAERTPLKLPVAVDTRVPVRPLSVRPSAQRSGPRPVPK
jgi:hypothetical protein